MRLSRDYRPKGAAVLRNGYRVAGQLGRGKGVERYSAAVEIGGLGQSRGQSKSRKKPQRGCRAEQPGDGFR